MIDNTGPCHSIVTSIQQVGDKAIEAITGRERERFLIWCRQEACVVQGNNKRAYAYVNIRYFLRDHARTVRRGHVAACGSTPCCLLVV